MPSQPTSFHRVGGLTWRKLDLHVHTPASADFDQRDLAPYEFIEKACAAGVEAIAVVDHNTGAWIDPLKAAANGRLVVFPGVEISATGGEQGSIHVLALFDTTATTRTVENLLGALGIRETEYGAAGTHTTRSPYEVIDTITAHGGLAVLAHADSSKGVLRDMRGEPRTRILNHPDLAAVEVHNFSKYFRLLDGTDANYRRKLAVYRASDNRSPTRDDCHSVDGIATRYTYFKMDGLTLESLRQCFCDREVRVCPDVEAEEEADAAYPRILEMSVSGGFLDGRVTTFHEGLNCIIGGKGVGKSLLVEFMRFALDQSSAIKSMRDDLAGKLETRLGLGGSVRVVVRLTTGQTLAVERRYDGVSNPMQVHDAVTGALVQAHVPELFRILAYSQTETVEIARNGTAQLALIDTFLDIADLEQRAIQLRTQLAEADKGLAQSLVAAGQVSHAREEVGSVETQLRHLVDALASPRFGELQQLVPKTDCLTQLKRAADQLSSATVGLSEVVRGCILPDVPPTFADDVPLAQVLTAATATVRTLTETADHVSAETERLLLLVENAQREWGARVQARTDDYRRWSEEVGGDQRQLLAKHQQLTQRLMTLQDDLAKVEARAAHASVVRGERAALLDELAGVYAERSERREREYAAITAASDGRLNLMLVREADQRAYLEAVLEFKRGSRLQQRDIQQLTDRVPPRELVDWVLAEDAPGLAAAAELDESAAQKLIHALWAVDDLADVLGLQHAVPPEDIPRIQFRRDDGSYGELTSLSVGQKCTALLIIALARGSMPVLIDQPEDALDVPSIFEDVTLHLRGRKDSRQFILTTHNATVAVTGDTDMFHVLKGDANTGTALVGGAIDRPDVRREVIQHLEGGRASFELKSRKYGIPVG